MRAGFFYSVCFIMIAVAGRGIAQSGDLSSSRGDTTHVGGTVTERPSNIEQLQKTVRESVEQIIIDGRIGSGERIAVQSPRDENSWLVDQATFDVLTLHGIRVTASGRTDSAALDGKLEFVPVALDVRYSPVFHDGLFGEARTGRSVEGKFTASLIGRDGTVRLSKIYSRVISDTVAVDAIPSLEHPSLQIAHGDPPAPGFFDALLAPVVILGSVAIAVYLLFSVRS